MINIGKGYEHRIIEGVGHVAHANVPNVRFWENTQVTQGEYFDIFRVLPEPVFSDSHPINLFPLNRAQNTYSLYHGRMDKGFIILAENAPVHFGWILDFDQAVRIFGIVRKLPRPVVLPPEFLPEELAGVADV